MFTFHHFGTASGLGVACLCLCAASAALAEAQPDANAPSSDASACRFVVGQAEIDGVMQQISGRACVQPDGSWQIVEGDAAALALAPEPVYYYDPWYLGPPVVFGGGVSVLFVDRFHHFHRMDHVRDGHGPHGMGGHGAPSMHMWGGTSHGGGGGMHR